MGPPARVGSLGSKHGSRQATRPPRPLRRCCRRRASNVRRDCDRSSPLHVGGPTLPSTRVSDADLSVEQRKRADQRGIEGIRRGMPADDALPLAHQARNRPIPFPLFLTTTRKGGSWRAITVSHSIFDQVECPGDAGSLGAPGRNRIYTLRFRKPTNSPRTVS